MFGFGKVRYEDRINAAIKESKPQDAEKVARRAFADTKAEESILAWAAASMYENGIASAFDLLEEFVSRYPNSLHLPRVYLADLLSRASRFDETTDFARYYLRLAKDSGAFRELSIKPILREGVSRSFLLLTSAYTTLGARSYSKRVLENSFRFSLEERWKEAIGKELEQLDRELLQPELASLDNSWEAFLSSGIGAGELFKRCNCAGFPLMAKRIDLLEGNFRFNPSFTVDENESLLIILESKNKEFVLC